MAGLIGEVPHIETAVLKQTAQAVRIEQSPMPRDMVALPPSLLEQSCIPGIKIGCLDDQGAARRQPSRDPAHDTRRLGDMLDDMKHGCKIDGGRRNVRAVLHPPLVDLIPAVAQLPYVLFRQVETVNAILRNAAAREQVKVPAIAAADVEERARDASLLQKAAELDPIQQLLALAGDEGSFVGTVVGVVGGWIDDGELGCRRSRIEPYRATFAALPEV